MNDEELRAVAPSFFGSDEWFKDEGFRIGHGWDGLVAEMARRIESAMPEARCTCIKEKFGELRVYWWAPPGVDRDNVRAIVDEATNISRTICDVCGWPGRMVAHDGWMRVRCPKHEGTRDRR
jgi:hypothetical protein